MPIPYLIDVHTHTQFAAFKDDQDAVIRRALDAGVWMINVGTQRDTSADAVATAERFLEGVYATVGLHPIHTDKSYHDAQELGIFSHSQEYENVVGKAGFISRAEEFDYEYYKNLASDQKVVGIGECGLDHYRIETHESRIKQEHAFRAQIEFAQEVKKPLMIHCRSAFEDLVKILDSYFMIHNSKPSGIIHFFSGTKDDARKLLDMGFSFSFGGVITFARDYDEVVTYTPLDRIVLETDAPYVTPAPFRGTRNEPLHIQEAAKKIAELKNSTLEKIAAQTVVNSRTVFHLI